MCTDEESRLYEQLYSGSAHTAPADRLKPQQAPHAPPTAPDMLPAEQAAPIGDVELQAVLQQLNPAQLQEAVLQLQRAGHLSLPSSTPGPAAGHFADQSGLSQHQAWAHHTHDNGRQEAGSGKVSAQQQQQQLPHRLPYGDISFWQASNQGTNAAQQLQGHNGDSSAELPGNDFAWLDEIEARLQHTPRQGASHKLSQS